MRIRINVFREKVSKSHYSEKNKGYNNQTQNVYRMKLLGKKERRLIKASLIRINTSQKHFYQS